MSNTNFDMQRSDLKKLNNAHVTEQYQVIISNRFAVLENLDDNMDITRASDVLDRIPKFQPKRVLHIKSYSSIKQSFIKNVQNH
jgi:hypothetical protein